MPPSNPTQILHHNITPSAYTTEPLPPTPTTSSTAQTPIRPQPNVGTSVTQRHQTHPQSLTACSRSPIAQHDPHPSGLRPPPSAHRNEQTAFKLPQNIMSFIVNCCRLYGKWQNLMQNWLCVLLYCVWKWCGLLITECIFVQVQWSETDYAQKPPETTSKQLSNCGCGTRATAKVAGIVAHSPRNINGRVSLLNLLTRQASSLDFVNCPFCFSEC